MPDVKYGYAHVRKLSEDVLESRTVEFVISDETKDRHGTILKIDGWKLDNYRKNPIVGYQHNLYGDMCSPPNPDDIIGRSEVRIEGKQLIARVTFEPADLNPQAEKIFRKVLFGTLSMASVGFMPLREFRQEKDKAGNIIAEYSDEHELVEWSVVNIPSNPNAGKREFAIETDRALRFVSDQLNGKLSTDDLRKMTVNNIIKLMNGEGVDADNKEAEVSQEIDYKRQQQLNRLSVDLAFHQTFEKELEIEDAKKRQELEAKKREARRNLHKFYLDNNEPLKEE